MQKIVLIQIMQTFINSLAVEFIYLATSGKCAGPINRQTAVKWIDFVQKNLNDEITVFFHCYVYLMAS